MIKRIAIIIALMSMALAGLAQKVTVKAVNDAAATVFRSIIEQTGKNFVYSSDLLKDLKINVNANNKPLKAVLDDIFKGTGITYSIKGKNVVLKRKKVSRRTTVTMSQSRPDTSATGYPVAKMLDEVVVVSRLEASPVETSEVGAKKITADEVRNTPAMFGESDVIKAMQMQPGVIDGAEGLAGMYVHGGNSDENLYMLDNVPLYQVNHFAGLFSAFNTDIIRYIDFFKTSMPAKYDGRLSSFMDVRLQNGNAVGHHGTARLGLTSGAFNISGPIGRKTTYLFGLRRSWYDVLTIPALAIVNSKSYDEKIRFRYYFMDLNAKVCHRFSSRLNGFISTYYGNDLLKTGSEDLNETTTGWYENDKYDFNWGNFVVQAGLNYRIRPTLTAEFTAAYTRYFSGMKHDDLNKDFYGNVTTVTHSVEKTENNINDWLFRGDFNWTPGDNSQIRFGANYVRHSFLPGRTSREYTFDDTKIETKDSTWAYRANEFNAYIEDDWQISDKFRTNIGLHASMFNIDGKTRYGISPRLSFSYKPNKNYAVKGAYSRTVQYVHQLTRTYLSLPTDRWIPIMGKFKPQTSDKVAVAGYWQSDNGMYMASVEGYYKLMHNIVDYRDEYYLQPPFEMWNARLTSGDGSAKGVDFKVEKTTGKVTGFVGYSLAWADRKFKDNNGGKRYPARFDNRHTINIVVNWHVSGKVSLNAAWVGHSGNRYTLLPQIYDVPDFGGQYYGYDPALKAPVNNYQLPFYHRLDLSCNVKNRRGYWTFGLYNAYCHLNTIGIRKSYEDIVKVVDGYIHYSQKPVFQKVKLLPVIPSISYTWQF